MLERRIDKLVKRFDAASSTVVTKLTYIAYIAVLLSPSIAKR